MAGLKSATEQMQKLTDLAGEAARTASELLNSAEEAQANQEIFSQRIGTSTGGSRGNGRIVIELQENPEHARLLNRVDEQMRRLDQTIQQSNALFGLRMRSNG